MNANAQTRPEPELLEREVPSIDVTALPALVRAEIDGQIATARAFPRSNAEFIRESTELVCLDAEVAESCIYSLPRGKDGKGQAKYITGPSARFAELVQYSFGNNRAGARVVAEDAEFVVAQGTYHDLQKNVQTTMEVKRRITDSRGKRYNSDMIGVTGNAACSIAHRNAVLKGIPKALWMIVYNRARAVSLGDVTTLSTKRAQALDWFAKQGVSPDQIFAGLGLGGVEDIGLSELETLAGLRTAIKNGDVTPENAFAPPPSENVAAPTSKSAVAEMAAALSKRNAGKQAPKDDGPTAQSVHDGIVAAQTLEALDEAADLIRSLPEPERPPLKALYESRRDSFDLPQ